MSRFLAIDEATEDLYVEVSEHAVRYALANVAGVAYYRIALDENLVPTLEPITKPEEVK